MSKDQGIGALMLVGAIAVILIFAWMITTEYALLALKIIAAIAVVGVMGIVAWIGYTLATTPPPPPLEDFGEERVVEEAEAVG